MVAWGSFGRVDLALRHHKAVAHCGEQRLSLLQLQQFEDSASADERLRAAALVQPHRAREQSEQRQPLEHKSKRAAAQQLDHPRVWRQPAILPRAFDLRARRLQNLTVLHTAWADRLTGAAIETR